jgi:hypothetical protein
MGVASWQFDRAEKRRPSKRHYNVERAPVMRRLTDIMAMGPDRLTTQANIWPIVYSVPDAVR